MSIADDFAGANCRVALMDVDMQDGLRGFLRREVTYRMLEVPFTGDSGESGIAIACGECADEDICDYWGPRVPFLDKCVGRITYIDDALPEEAMPLVPPVDGEPGDPEVWMDISAKVQTGGPPHVLPDGPWIYPAPGYLRLVYRAHASAGGDMAEDFLESTLLMDRKTSLSTYLDSNPLLKEWVTDPKLYEDRPCDATELKKWKASSQCTSPSNCVYQPSDFEHLSKDGFVTIIGFGSLVSEASVRGSFDIKNFRYGTAFGTTRIFNRASWKTIEFGSARTPTAEIATVSMSIADDLAGANCRVALMDVDMQDGLRGFLRREVTYRMLEVPFTDDSGESGIAIACGECADEDICDYWGPRVPFLDKCVGRITYIDDALPEEAMPLVPPVDGEPGDPEVWMDISAKVQTGGPPHVLPDGPWIYPAPGYLRLVYRAHASAGGDMAEDFLETTLLMDRKASLSTYLDSNPLLKEWVTDPKLYEDRPCDATELKKWKASSQCTCS
ncbi:unnamed protein product [Polarella glacialis]|uniref:Uncharacterized protein n=1 Tax=Polarella glacialis TaxID=89957 RepID=A0A813FNY3_POLGL|nr:unnamed protein product [Polarella glacialis]